MVLGVSGPLSRRAGIAVLIGTVRSLPVAARNRVGDKPRRYIDPAQALEVRIARSLTVAVLVAPPTRGDATLSCERGRRVRSLAGPIGSREYG